VADGVGAVARGVQGGLAVEPGGPQPARGAQQRRRRKPVLPGRARSSF
jgi:hypothetical protein